MTRVEVTKRFRYSGDEYSPGDVVDPPGSAAQSVIEKGYGREAEGGDAPEVGGSEGQAKSAETPRRLQKTDEGVDGYAASSSFLSTDDVEEGDELTIKGEGRADYTFDRERLILPVEVNGESYQWRVNKTNARILSDAFGSKTGSWVGETAEIRFEEYKGLGQKGIVVRVPGGED